MKYPKFQLFQSSVNSQFYFRLKAQNGEIILGSEGYTSKQNCQAAIASVRLNAQAGLQYERKDSLSNYTFNLKAGNGEIIGRSENYTSMAAREKGIEAVKKDAPTATIEDLT